MRILLAIERLNSLIGKTAGWLIVALTFVMSYEVFVRYALNAPTEWAFDASYILYGALFMLAGAYTLARNGHVRGDFLYRSWLPKTQARMDLVLYILFFFPGIIAFIYAGWTFTRFSWLMNERSAASPNGPFLWPFKALIPITGVFMLLQGIVETARCVICLRTGAWPRRLHDVEELENVILMEEAERRKQAAITQAEAIGSQKGAL